MHLLQDDAIILIHDPFNLLYSIYHFQNVHKYIGSLRAETCHIELHVSSYCLTLGKTCHNCSMKSVWAELSNGTWVSLLVETPGFLILTISLFMFIFHTLPRKPILGNTEIQSDGRILLLTLFCCCCYMAR